MLISQSHTMSMTIETGRFVGVCDSREPDCLLEIAVEEARNPTRAHLRLLGSDQGFPGFVGRGRISTQDVFGTSIWVIVYGGLTSLKKGTLVER